MSEQWTRSGTSSTGGAAGPGPTTGRPRRLERSTTDKMLAGVAGGLGQYFGLDPVIFRIAFAVLALAGGGGVLLYALAWVLLPVGDQPRSTLHTKLVERDGKGKRVVAAVVIVLGAIALIGDLDHLLFGRGLVRFAGLAAVVAALVWLFNNDDRSEADAPPPPPPTAGDPWPVPSGPSSWSPAPSGGPSPEAPAHPAADAGPALGAGAGPTLEVGPGPVASEGVGPVGLGGPAWLSAGAGADPTEPLEAIEPAEHVGGTPPPPPPPGAPPPGGRAPGGAATRSLTLLVISLLLVGAGCAALVGLHLTVFLSLALVVVGLALLSGGRWGRSRGLIPVGILLVVALGMSTAVNFVGVPLRGGAGERRWQPLTVDELPDEYRLGVGSLHLDLTDLRPGRGDDDVEIDASVGVGELVVTVPPAVDVVVEGRAGVGELDLLGQRRSGRDVEQVVRQTSSRFDGPTFELDLEVGMGEVRVRRGTV